VSEHVVNGAAKWLDGESFVTADLLIKVFGDQAYHKGCDMVIESLKSGDAASSRALSRANIELLKRGYADMERAS
jgi:hypothetical protein